MSTLPLTAADARALRGNLVYVTGRDTTGRRVTGRIAGSIRSVVCVETDQRVLVMCRAGDLTALHGRRPATESPPPEALEPATGAPRRCRRSRAKQTPQGPSPADIVAAVLPVVGVAWAELAAPYAPAGVTSPVSVARELVTLLCRDRCSRAPYQSIARAMGRGSHSTIMAEEVRARGRSGDDQVPRGGGLYPVPWSELVAGATAALARLASTPDTL